MPELTLQALRHSRAEAAFEAYDFGDGVSVEGASGWEWTAPGREMSRKVYLSYADAEEADGSGAANFTVTFESTSSPVVLDASALLTSSGGEIGYMPEKALKERVNDKLAMAASAVLELAPQRRPRP